MSVACRTGLLIGLIATLGGAGSGCGDGSDATSGAGRTRPDLVELEDAPTDRLEPAVREELEQKLAQVRRLSREPTVTDQALGAAYGELGRKYHGVELFESALPCYTNARALLPGDPRWSYYLGQAYRSVSDLEQAGAALERARELNPGDDPTLLALAQIHREQRRFQQATELAHEILARSPDSAGALLLMAELSAEGGDDAAAVGWYERLLRLQPQATRLYQPLAMAHRAIGNTEKAKEYLQKRGDGAVRIDDPLMWELQELRSGFRQQMDTGIAAYMRGDYVGAAAAFGQVVEARPDDVGARLNLGSALTRLGRLKEAAHEFRQVLALDPGHSMAHFNLGVVLAQLGDDEESVRHYREALRIDPDYRDPRYNLANTLRNSGRCDLALEHYGRLKELDPGNPAVRLGEALCLNGTGRQAEALERLEEGLRVLPANPALGDMVARLLAAATDAGIRDGERALDLARRLAAERPSRDSLATLAMALAETGRFEEAVATQREAISLAEGSDRPDLLEGLRTNLQRYERGEPCRDLGY